MYKIRKKRIYKKIISNISGSSRAFGSFNFRATIALVGKMGFDNTTER